MSAKKFKFVSPGVFINEIDNSQLTEEPTDLGPVIIGRSVRGPALKPVQINSFSEFVTVFGAPPPANSPVDAWRSGDLTAPMYAVYAAQSWLRNNSPITFVRLLGDEHPNKTTDTGEAGWYTRDTDDNFNGVGATGGGAYGLFMCPSSSMTGAIGANIVTGSLAAVWYFNEGHITLSGTVANAAGTGAAYATSSWGMLINSADPGSGTDKVFQADIWAEGAQSPNDKICFSLDKNSDKYIRKVFNTNPTQANHRLLTDEKKYFLGETFDRHRREAYLSGSKGLQAASEKAFAAIVPLKNIYEVAAQEQGDRRKPSQNAQTGWFFSQDLTTLPPRANIGTPGDQVTNSFQSTSMQNLFKFHALNSGVWTTKNLKISIANIRTTLNSQSQYGSFSVEIRNIQDLDSAPQIVERFDNCNLNPESDRYVAKVIGDKYRTWDSTNNRYIVNGDYNNNSRFIRIEIHADVAMQLTDERLLPFGVYGPLRFKALHWASGSAGSTTNNVAAKDVPLTPIWGLPASSGSTPIGGKPLGTPIEKSDDKDNAPFFAVDMTKVPTQTVGVGSFTASFEYPKIYTRVSSSDGTTQSPAGAYFGASVNEGSAGYSTYDQSTSDVLLSKARGIDDFAIDTNLLEHHYVFTLDDISQSGSVDVSPNAFYASGSRQSGYSVTAVTGTYKGVLDAGFDQFTTVLHGGNDGLDIYEKEPFNNSSALASTATGLNSYAYYSVTKAIDSVSDAEVVEYNLATMPGITNSKLGDYLVSVCENRGDALAILDLPSVYLPATDAGSSGADRYGNSPSQAITALKNRSLNSSYACAYYPWVQVQDTINNRTLWAPPSIAAIGTFSSSQTKTKLWFAPAGFNRGGLTDGSAGIPVIGVREKLTSKQRDELYEAGINPIASFPAEGIVIFGQKTLQLQKSALDRINVRRLMIYVKKQISRMANNILFDQNVPATWNRFLAQVNPFLEGIRSDFGLTDFKVVLDETTTTPDLIDRNILYAKIFLKPARAIEYIAIDFNISNTGAAFDD